MKQVVDKNLRFVISFMPELEFPINVAQRKNIRQVGFQIGIRDDIAALVSLNTGFLNMKQISIGTDTCCDKYFIAINRCPSAMRPRLGTGS